MSNEEENGETTEKQVDWPEIQRIHGKILKAKRDVEKREAKHFKTQVKAAQARTRVLKLESDLVRLLGLNDDDPQKGQ